MLISWWKRRRRRKLLAQPFPAEWLRYLEKNVAHYRHLTPAEQTKLRDDLRIFIAEKHWEGCGGLQLTDEMKVTVAAHACLMLLGLDSDSFQRVRTILIYPSGWSFKEEISPDPDAEVIVVPIEEVGEEFGESVGKDVVLLSWANLLKDLKSPDPGTNLVIHEFTHQLDSLNGADDGTPLLRDEKDYARWHQVMAAEYNQLREATRRKKPTLLDKYGTTDEGEFFAVASECFFTRPVEMARRHRKLYDLLRDYYGQDPAARRGYREPAPDVQED